MPATAKSFNPNKFIAGPADAWVIDVPADGAFITLFTDGTPDSTAHPTAKHLGHTDSGFVFKASGGDLQKIFVDEVKTAIRTTQGEGVATISCSLTQGADKDLLALLTSGAGTKFTATGKEGVKGGTVALAYVSIVLIYKSVADATKFEVLQLYKCQNSAGIELQVNNKDISRIPVVFEGLAITSRTATDSTWINWVQTA